MYGMLLVDLNPLPYPFEDFLTLISCMTFKPWSPVLLKTEAGSLSFYMNEVGSLINTWGYPLF